MAEQKVDFKQVADCIFVNKGSYINLSDEDKYHALYKLNQKFACKFPKHAALLNSKFMDRASAIDVWSIHFAKDLYLPSWYWTKVEKVKIIKDYTNKEVEIFKKYNEDFNDRDIEFIMKHFKEEVKEEIRILSKFED